MAWSEPTFLLPCRRLFISHLSGFVCSTQVPRRLHYPACFEGRRTSNRSHQCLCYSFGDVSPLVWGSSSVPEYKLVEKHLILIRQRALICDVPLFPFIFRDPVWRRLGGRLYDGGEHQIPSRSSHTHHHSCCASRTTGFVFQSRSPLTLSHFLKNSSSLIILDAKKLEWLSPVSSFSQDRDFCLLHPGDPVFLSFSGETLRYKGKEALYPFFVNECAFYETGVALSLARRRRVEIPDIQCSRTWRAYSREKDEK